MIKNINDLKKIALKICQEHYELSKTTDNNVNYLWYLYSQGTKAGDYKPFIFFAEINLNKALGLIDEEEQKRMYNLIESTDDNDFYIVYLAIKYLKTKRKKQFGINVDDPVYNEIKKNYSSAVLSHDLFIKIKNN